MAAISASVFAGRSQTCAGSTSSNSRRWTSAACRSSRSATASGCRWSRSTASGPSSTTSTRPRLFANCTHKVRASSGPTQGTMRAGTMEGVLQTATQGVTVADRLTVGVAARLSRYLQVLTQAKKMGKERISSQEMSDYTNINATQIRRDLSAFGKFGKRGVGYNIDSLLGEIRKILRTQGQHNIALIGAGRLGQAIASSSIFAEHGINIAAVFDRDPDVVGRSAGGVEVQQYGDLKDAVRDKNIIVVVFEDTATT